MGIWLGDGVSDGTPVRDCWQFTGEPGTSSLRFTYTALDGDSYKGEGFLALDTRWGSFECRESNNGYWPERHHHGRLEGPDRLVFSERAEDRHVRLELVLEGDDTLHMTESRVVQGNLEPFAIVRFERVNSCDDTDDLQH